MSARLYWLDFLKILAAIAVVWLHSTGFVFREANELSASWWVATFINAATRWSVPIFVMASGALYLSVSSGTTSLVTLYRKRFGRLLVPLVFWTVVYLLVTQLFIRPLTVGEVAELIGRGRPFYHLWYLYMLVGLLLITPFVNRVVWSVSKRTLLVVMALCFITAGLIDTWQQLQGHADFQFFLALGPQYLGYFIAGHYFANVNLKRKQVMALAMGAVVSFILIAVLGRPLEPALGEHASMWVTSYLNPLVIMTSVAIFVAGKELASRYFGSDTLRHWVSVVTPLAFGVYLVHPLWLALVLGLPLARLLSSPIAVPMVATFVVLMSALSVHILLRIPGLRRVVA